MKLISPSGHQDDIQEEKLVFMERKKKKGPKKGLTCLIDEPEPTTLNQIDLQKYLNIKDSEQNSPKMLTDKRVLNFTTKNDTS